MAVILLMIYILHYLRNLNCGNYGIFLIMGNAGYVYIYIYSITRSYDLLGGFYPWGSAQLH